MTAVTTAGAGRWGHAVAPCSDCGTLGGSAMGGSTRPSRRLGRCANCYTAQRRKAMKESRSRGACPARRRQQVHQDCWAPRLDSELPVLNPRFGVGDLTPAAFSRLIRRAMHPGPAPGLARLLTAEAIGRGRGP